MNTRLSALITLAALILAPAGAGAATITNPLAGPITLDGRFSGGVSGGLLVGEWSDVTPLAFIAPATETGTPQPAAVGDPRVNSLLYAAVAPGVGPVPEEGHELYLMYDYLGRTDTVFAPGAQIMDIRFPIRQAGRPDPLNIVVRVKGADSSGTPIFGSSSFFDVFVELDLPGGGLACPPFPRNCGMAASVGFDVSTLSLTPHLLVELEVPLLLPPGFSNTIEGDPNGVYSPDPAFWGASSSKDVGDPPISFALFEINPDGSTLLIPIPEPTPVFLLAVGALAWCFTGRPWLITRRGTGRRLGRFA